MQHIVDHEGKAGQVLYDKLVARPRWCDLFHLADQHQQLSRPGFRRLRRSESRTATLFDRLLVLGSKRLGHEQDVSERPALDGHLPGRLEKVPADIPPMPFTGPSGCPGSELCLVPEIVKE